MFKNQIVKILGAVCLAVCAASAVAQQHKWSLEELETKTQRILSNPDLLRETLEAGKRASFFCVHCHGEAGMAAAERVPNLTEQSVSYLFEQNIKYATGERKDEFMEGLLKVLSPDEILQISIFYSMSKTHYPPADPKKEGARLRGKDLYGRFCRRCHGKRGLGDGADGEMMGAGTIPRVAGQPTSYMTFALKRYKDNPTARMDKLMVTATQKLKDEEIEDLAEFLLQLR